MRQLLPAIALVALTAGQAEAQANNGYDAYGISEESTPLDELVPENTELPAPQAFFDDDLDSDTDFPLDAVETVQAEEPAPVSPEPLLGQTAEITVPADWQEHALKGVLFSTPADWQVVRDEDEHLMLSGFDMEAMTGPAVSVDFEPASVVDEILGDDDVTILSESDIILPGGIAFTRYEMRMQIPGPDGPMDSGSLLYIAKERGEGDLYIVIHALVVNAEFSQYSEVFEQVLASVRFEGLAPYTRPETLEGLVSYDFPDIGSATWDATPSADSEFAGFGAPGYQGYIVIAIGDWVSADQGFDSDVPAGTTSEASQILGQPSQVYTWTVEGQEFYTASFALVSGEYTYHRLDMCLPDGRPVGVKLAGGSAYLHSGEFTEALAAITLNLPDGMIDCASGTNLQPAPELAATAIFTPPADWQSHTLGGYTFWTPPDWAVVQDRRKTLMVFGGDQATRTGPLVGLYFDDEGIPGVDGAEILSRSDVILANGGHFQRTEMQVQLDGGINADMVAYMTPQTNSDGDHAVIMLTVYNDAFDTHRALLENILATLTIPATSRDEHPVAEQDVSADALQEAAGVNLVNVDGAQFRLAANWRVVNDRPADKLYESPDQRFAVLAFWRLPSEPLTGQDSIISEQPVDVGGEPAIRTFSQVDDLTIVRILTNRQRADGKRFVFTVVGNGVSSQELRVLYDELLVSLSLAGGFGPNDVIEPAPMLTQQVRFDGRSIGGWQIENGILSISRNAGPDGGAVLAANTPGDYANGYYIAPEDVLGDWRFFGGLQATLRMTSGSGRYFEGFDEGARGDFYIANGAMSASIIFDNRIETSWLTQSVRFDDPSWVLAGGAQSLDDVLVNVTDFHIRAEYLVGDTSSELAGVDWTAVGAAPASVEGN